MIGYSQTRWAMDTNDVPLFQLLVLLLRLKPVR